MQAGKNYGKHIQESSGNLSNINLYLRIHIYVCIYIYKI